ILLSRNWLVLVEYGVVPLIVMMIDGRVLGIALGSGAPGVPGAAGVPAAPGVPGGGTIGGAAIGPRSKASTPTRLLNGLPGIAPGPGPNGPAAPTSVRDST